MQFLITTHLGFEAFLPSPAFSQIEQANLNIVDLNLEVFPSWFEGCKVSWTPLPTWNTADVNYNIYRSEQQEDGFLKLNSIPLQQPYFKDKSNKDSSVSANEWYIVEAIVTRGSQVTLWRTKATEHGGSLPPMQKNIHTEINHRHWVLLREFVGLDAIILRKKRYGRNCPECWSHSLQKPMKDNCLTCFGVGIEGGYYPGIETKCQFDASQDNRIYTYFGKFEPNQLGMWTIYYPKIESLDIVIRKKDLAVFRVDSIAPSEMLAVQSRQICQVTELPRTHFIHNLVKREGLLP